MSCPSLVLTTAEAHIWRVSLDDISNTDRRVLEQALSQDERERAGRFRSERDRVRYIAARGILRDILGRYLAREPARLRFVYGPHGKPALAPAREPDLTPLSFNLSHAHGLALYAVAAGRCVGIDVEKVRPDAADSGIAERFFSPREVAALRALPSHLQQETFFRCWTRKEAYVKARGEGLALPLDSFDVSLAPGEPAAIVATRPDPREAARWSLHDVDAGPGYAAALVVEGRGVRVMERQWLPPPIHVASR